MALELSRGLATTEINGPTLRTSGLTGLEWTQGICVSKELLGIAGPLHCRAPGHTLRATKLQNILPETPFRVKFYTH